MERILAQNLFVRRKDRGRLCRLIILYIIWESLPVSLGTETGQRLTLRSLNSAEAQLQATKHSEALGADTHMCAAPALKLARRDTRDSRRGFDVCATPDGDRGGRKGAQLVRGPAPFQSQREPLVEHGCDLLRRARRGRIRKQSTCCSIANDPAKIDEESTTWPPSHGNSRAAPACVSIATTM
jgi:hypothetical protein